MPNGSCASEQQPTSDGQEAKSVWAGWMNPGPEQIFLPQRSSHFEGSSKEREGAGVCVGITTQQPQPANHNNNHTHCHANSRSPPHARCVVYLHSWAGQRGLWSVPGPHQAPTCTNPCTQHCWPWQACTFSRPNLSPAAQFSSHAHATYRASDHSPYDAPLCAKPVKAGCSGLNGIIKPFCAANTASI